MWESKVIGDDTPFALQRAVFFTSEKRSVCGVDKNSASSENLTLFARLIPTVTPMSNMGRRIFQVLIRNK